MGRLIVNFILGAAFSFILIVVGIKVATNMDLEDFVKRITEVTSAQQPDSGNATAEEENTSQENEQTSAADSTESTEAGQGENTQKAEAETETSTSSATSQASSSTVRDNESAAGTAQGSRTEDVAMDEVFTETNAAPTAASVEEPAPKKMDKATRAAIWKSLASVLDD
ncbi:hypothetical protein [Maridesulfovibrio sp.]|uniref:hypothetical protein n=1 Tax=Maridesulfovibrio sp. TaxID=2795000 RepID=UPI0039F0030F